MKIAISIPDALFNEAEITARQLGLARSQLYVRAIKDFVEHHNEAKITEKLNSIYSKSELEQNVEDLGLGALREATKDDAW